MPIYKIGPSNAAQQIKAIAFPLETILQDFCEANLEQLFGVRYVARQFSTGDKHGGRMDTLGLDFEGNPTIIEYKKDSSENIITQGLFYLDWLMDHKGDFVVAARKKIQGLSDEDVKWNSPRVILVAQSYGKYDPYAANRIGVGLELWTYQLYEGDLIAIEPPKAIITTNKIAKSVVQQKKPAQAEAQVDAGQEPIVSSNEAITPPLEEYTIEQHVKKGSNTIQQLFADLSRSITGLGGDVEEMPRKLYIAYRHGRNFAEVVIQKDSLVVFIDLPKADLDDPSKLAEDVSKVGHWGTGAVRVRLASPQSLSDVVSLIKQSYEHTL